VEISERSVLCSNHRRDGFALIATISVMVLLLMVALAMLSLSTLEVRGGARDHYRSEARANARMGLMLAIGELQKQMGADQRVCARAGILEDRAPVANGNWLGVWKTTLEENGREWPLIGKSPDVLDVRGSPYPYRGIYSDLRRSNVLLKNGAWREKLLRGWLVSNRSALPDPFEELKLGDSSVVEMLGRGTLGKLLSDGAFSKNRVLVEKVNVNRGGRSGAYAWYVSDNNQKASLALAPTALVGDQIAFLGSPSDNPTAVESLAGERPYQGYVALVKGESGTLVSDRTVELLDASEGFRGALGADFHSFTTHGSGLFVDVALGGLKKDLTPLMFGNPEREVIVFPAPLASVAKFDFSSELPMIPGAYHAVLGPSFGALRYWGRMKYLELGEDGAINAQVTHADDSSTRSQPIKNWPGGVADGLTFDAAQWASKAPKIHPVMTDVRWHYYFSHTEGTLNSLRTHIQPRVCLWNPYNVRMKTSELLVLMANPYQNDTAFHFTVDRGEADRVSALYPEEPPEGALISNRPDKKWPFDGEPKFKMSHAGLFPEHRYLGFVLEATAFEAGECLVFSPKVTQADFSSGEVNIQKYNADQLGRNLLSARAAQGGDHFFHDYTGGISLLTLHQNSEGKRVKSWTLPQPSVFEALDLNQVMSYRPWAVLHDNFPFVLKSVNHSTMLSVEEVTATSQSAFPTLQLMNHGNGGVLTYHFWTQNLGDSTKFESPFGEGLLRFEDDPTRQGSRVHQWGAKLLWLDESQTEGGSPPLRSGYWADENVAFHPTPIRDWNVRPGMVTRSPAAPCTESWAHTSSGAWLLQLDPFSPGDFEHAPSMDAAGYFRKSPLAPANQLAESRAVLFDLPDRKYGAFSLGALRHAALSPYSWHPSYIVGSSAVSLHAPFEASAYLSQAGAYSGAKNSRWDESIAGYTNPWSAGKYGPRLAYENNPQEADSTSLLQVGDEAGSKSVEGVELSSEDEVLAYDIAFEVNQNLWDAYFISGIPILEDGSAWSPLAGEELWNARYQMNLSGGIDQKTLAEKLSGADGFAFAFWNSARFLKNKGAFNVNSTSVQAWTAFLSGLQGVVRETESGFLGDGAHSVFSRVRKPIGAELTSQVGVEKSGGWAGGRMLGEDELRRLAEEVVNEVKERGPFVSLADFVNRRLAPKSDPASQMGVLDAAISRSGLNTGVETSRYRTSSVVDYDNNRPEWRLDPDKQSVSKAWGIPGFLTQGDLLEPLAPAMTVRGDSFLIRCYGEARDERGKVRAKAYLEAQVVRLPDYVESSVNQANEPMLELRRSTGELIEGGLSEVNRKFGRQFKIESFRWLSEKEV